MTRNRLSLDHFHTTCLLIANSFLHTLYNADDLRCKFLQGVNSVDAESIKEVTSIRGFFMLLQEKQLFTKTDVLFMQLLLRKVGCKELYEKCIQYARKQRALCLFEKDPGIICMNHMLHNL